MNKKAKILVLSLAIVGSISIGAAAFVQFIPEVFSSNTDSGSAENETYIVRFADADNSILKSIECKKGDTLDILDAPRYSSNKVWKATTNDQDGNPVFLNTHPEINQAYIFKEVSESDASLQGKVMPSSQNIGFNGCINESYDKNKINEVDLYTWDEFIYHNTWGTAVVGYESSLIDIKTGHYNYEGNAKYLVNEKKADKAVGLQSVKNEIVTKYNYSYSNNSWSQTTQNETNTVTATPYIDEVIDTTSSSAISNYCPIRIQLQNDVVFTGDLTLGARVGISDSATDWGQSKLQNIINGAYAELDLNGYNLVIARGASIDAYGSVTDSKGTGNLIIEDGAEMWATMVVEDAAREDSYPTQFLWGGQAMNFFKCPYLNCNITFKQGCKFYVKVGIRLGGNSNEGLWLDLPFIAPSSETPFIAFTSDSGGIIQRTTGYNEDIYIGGSDFAKRNLMDMQIEYNLLSGNIQVNGFNMEFGYSSINGKMPTNRSPFFIPPYYRFHLYPNTSTTINNLYIFMPSSYLIVDARAEVVLAYTDELETDEFGGYVSQRTYQGVGGLYFLDYYQPYSEGYKYVDTSLVEEGDGYGATIYKDDRKSSNNAFNFYNGYPAYCKLDGTIKTVEANIPLMHKYTVAGKFEVANFDAEGNSFKNLIEQQDDVQTFASVHQIGPSRFSHGRVGVGDYIKINIMGYYNSPLIVNGYVVTPMDGETLPNYNKTRTYDRLNKLVIQKNETNVDSAFAFIFDDVFKYTDDKHTYEVNYYLALDKNGTDCLTGKFLPVNYDSSIDVITIPDQGDQQYMLYQGAYLKSNIAANATNTNASITKLWGVGAGKTGKVSKFLGFIISFDGFENYPDISKIDFKLDDDVLNQPITDAKMENGQVVYKRDSNKSWKLTTDLPKPFDKNYTNK